MLCFWCFLNIRSELESAVWAKALLTYSEADLRSKVSRALHAYKRKSGLDRLSRLHASHIGHANLQVLFDALLSDMPAWDGNHQDGYLEIRSSLRHHVARYLQWQLICDGATSDQIHDAYSQRI